MEPFDMNKLKMLRTCGNMFFSPNSDEKKKYLESLDKVEASMKELKDYDKEADEIMAKVESRTLNPIEEAVHIARLQFIQNEVHRISGEAVNIVAEMEKATNEQFKRYL